MLRKTTILLLAGVFAAVSQAAAEDTGYSSRFQGARAAAVDYQKPLHSTALSRPAQSLQSGCDRCGEHRCAGRCESGCSSAWGQRSGVFADWLYLRPRNAEVAYALPVNGPLAADPDFIPVAPAALADPGYDSGFRVGVNFALDDCSSVVGSYTWYESETTNSIDLDELGVGANDVLVPLVSQPATFDAATVYRTASASNDIDFQLADVAYQSVFAGGPTYNLRWLLGVRYGKLDQDFASSFTAVGDSEFVASEIDFDGVGFRLGLGGERYVSQTGLMLYTNAAASFLAGEFQADYLQSRLSDPVVAETGWKDGRVAPVLDIEAGLGWQSPGGGLRVTAGYLFAAWYNTITTQEWIDAVETNEYDGLSDTLTFDGLRLRVEGRF